ncbi:amino acid adenylation domain-containing protein [Streptomyces syringium]|uniref:amino acid adenylation domain-containing protein n=1 Tax=Streptomyces syringium TaxID=76729 RepID=UPI003424F303
MFNPIDDASMVLVNSEGQYALWAGHLDAPAGWRVACQKSSRQECLDYVDEHWADIRPRNPTGDGAVPVGTGVHHLIADQAARTPNAAALIWDDQQLTYAELHEQSNRLARFLTERGIGRGAHVGLCVERSPLMITALLAVLKAGAAYVPLDPDYPVRRLRYILADTGAELLLTQEHLETLFPDYSGEVISLDKDRERIAGMPATDIVDAPSDAAYVIHTSGSTGDPKGVLVTHRSLANHSFAVNKHFELAPGDRVLQCRSLSFDAAAEEIFPALLHGAALVLGSDPLRQTFRALTQQVIDTGTTFLSVPTAFWHSWILEEDCLLRLASESSLRTVVVAGEKADKAALLTWNKWLGQGVRWFNVYGPTEGTITSTVYRPGGAWEGDGYSSVPIGHAIDNVHAYILDDSMKPTPAGEIGELYIGGDGVAVGYLNKPGLTAEKFLPDPFSGAHGKRMYRTGDLVRAEADGCIEFISRRDHQVKLRGYRIELGEIEFTLAGHPDVRTCVALVNESGASDTTLVCCVVTYEGAAVSADALTVYLRHRLPWYMVPAELYIIDEIPLTPNGKVDRKTLLSMCAHIGSATDHLAPRTPVEAVLVSVWEEVLDRPGISVDADFFQSGGHSLLAATLISRMRARLGVSIPVRALFQSPTVAGLAAAIAQMTPEGAVSDTQRN